MHNNDSVSLKGGEIQIDFYVLHFENCFLINEAAFKNISSSIYHSHTENKP